ncbi:MMPL family transporter [Dactylosporangium aurantiacum]|uniref:MMPL family transporter n=1 Tax=Dactylosporangium aurantiacum TaxID=35754 RepID=A0A9Q9MCT2_9ACTN|nr:MMPL family transporter [Dactylosporangium aurantiacum]MDG6109549.1 MMPL family transporter [Dactylosporangium aurantiacum]UWZ51294.1 MMPL family transporter [Dactylosporangium aurantiacum]
MARSAAAWITGRAGVVVVLLVTAVLAVLTFAFSPDQPAAEATDGLPAGAQSTRVTAIADRFASGRAQTAIVVFERQDAPLTDADRAAIAAAEPRLAAVPGVTQGPPPAVSDDRQAALLVVPLRDGLDDQAVYAAVDALRGVLRDAGLPNGLTGQVTGGAAFGRDIDAAFDGADVTLLLATVIVVAVLLLVTYRSPILWIVPLVVIGLADQVVAQLLPWVARLVGERTDAAVSGIVSVLVFGAGTDYALLFIARYREQLRHDASRREAMTAALRGAGPAIVASAGTVVLALLTLLAATLTGNRTLGVSAALGVLVALGFSLVVLPAALVGLPRAVFWPRVPRPGTPDPTDTGLWSRIAAAVGRRPGVVLAVAVVLLAGLATGLARLDIGLAQTEQFRTQAQSVTAQQALARHFPAGASQPAVVVAKATAEQQTMAVARNAPGVAGTGAPERSDDGTLVQFTVELTSTSGSPEADWTVQRLRTALAGVPDAAALVGGQPATDLDRREANLRDDRVVVPLILAVVLLVLIALLRSLLAPVLLLGTVVASFAASLGAATVVLRTVFDQSGLDAGVPLLSFLFLVALGVDYNIFLVTRAREETAARGDTRAGTLRALAATGGVITSAGILLAAVFTVLGVLPVIVLTQIGVIVGIGVLLDTLLVRTVVVPAIALLLKERFWWPAQPAAVAHPAEPQDTAQPMTHQAALRHVHRG